MKTKCLPYIHLAEEKLTYLGKSRGREHFSLVPRMLRRDQPADSTSEAVLQHRPHCHRNRHRSLSASLGHFEPSR